MRVAVKPGTFLFLLIIALFVPLSAAMLTGQLWQTSLAKDAAVTPEDEAKYLRTPSRGEITPIFDEPDKMHVVDLTAAGSQDWVYWGESTSQVGDILQNPVRKVARGKTVGMIGECELINPGGELIKAGTRGLSRGVRWSDGSPVTVSSLSYGASHTADNGFRFRVRTPEGIRPKALRVYVGGWRASGVFSVSSPGAESLRVERVEDIALEKGYYSRVFRVDCRTVAPGQEVVVEWRQDRGFGNVSLQAAALE